MSKFLEQAIKAQAERIRCLERENINLKAKIENLESLLKQKKGKK